MNNEDVMLRAENISKAYYHQGNTISVLSGVDISVKRKEFFVLTGPSGAGKSTLLHILAGIDKPDVGEIFLNNERISGISDKEISSIRNKKIGFVFQFYNLLNEFTVFENIILPYDIGIGKVCKSHTRRSEINKKVFKILDMIELSNRASFKPFQLSGGQQQKVAIARALINQPEILFCDEPTGNLDSKSSEAVMALLKMLNKEERITLILATHNTEIIKGADRILKIKDGLLSF